MFSILGPLEVRTEGGVVAVGGRRQRALLALLLLRANEVVSVDALAEGLWGRARRRRAARSLQVFVSDVRKALRAAGEDGRIVTQSPGYRIDVRPGELDLDAVRAAGRRRPRRARRGEPAAAAETLREALALWRGEPLADFAYEPFAQAAVRAARGAAAVGARGPGGGGSRAGQARGARRRARGARVRSIRTGRGCAAHLILALYRAGRQSEALAGVPGDAEAAARGAGDRPDAGAAGAGARDPRPGSEPRPDRRARSAREAGRVEQPAAPADAARRPRARARGAGAAVELGAARDAHRPWRDRQDAARPGRGGAPRGDVRRRRQVRPACGVTDPALVPSTLALALQVEDGDDVVDAVAEKELLLCLDNLEQLLDAAPFVGELLARCPGLRLLVTSRSPLKLAGEVRVPARAARDGRGARAVHGARRAVVARLLRGRARGGDPRDLRAPRPPAARTRARRRPRAPALAAGAPRPARAGAAAPHRRPARPARAPADAPRRDRLELPAARPGRAAPLPRALSLPRRLRPRGRDCGLRAGRARAARPAVGADRAQPRPPPWSRTASRASSCSRRSASSPPSSWRRRARQTRRDVATPSTTSSSRRPGRCRSTATS